MLGEVAVLGKLEEALQVAAHQHSLANDHRLLIVLIIQIIDCLTEYLITDY